MSHNIRQRQQCFVKSILRRNLDFITCGDKYGGSIPLTRSSLRLKRIEERRLERPPQPCAKADINSRFKLRLAGQPSNALRLPIKIGIVSKAAVCRIDARSQKATYRRSQYRAITAYRQVLSMDACRVFRFFQRKSRDRVRKISQIRLRMSFRKASFLLRSGSQPTTRRIGLSSAEESPERSEETVREGRCFLG